MKKLLTFLTVLSVLLSLCACATKPLESSSYSEPEPTIENEAPTEAVFASGKVEGNVYYSEFSELKITAPNENWSFADKNYLLSLIKIDETAEEHEKSDEEIAKKVTIYDARLSDIVTGSTILVMYENLEVLNKPEMTEIDLANEVEAELRVSNSYDVSKPYTVILSSKKYTRLDCSTRIDDQDVFVSYFIRKIGKYMLVICVTPGVTGDVTLENMLSFIS